MFPQNFIFAYKVLSKEIELMFEKDVLSFLKITLKT
jgi:hypothetical protein